MDIRKAIGRDLSKLLPALRDKSNFWRHVVETYSTRVVLLVMALVITVLVSRFLGPAGRGLFAVATVLGAMGVQFGNLGLQAANTYHVARDRRMLEVLTGNALVVSFGLGGLGAVLAGVILWHYPGLAPVKGTLLVLALAWIPLGLAYQLLQNLLLGIQEIQTYNQIELAGKVITLILIGCVIWSHRLSADYMFAATLIALAISVGWVWLRLRKFLQTEMRVCLATFKETIGIGMKAYIIAFFGFLLLRIDLLMVNYILGAKQAGYYSISETMAENVLLLPIVTGTVLFPKLAGMPSIAMRLRLAKKAVLATAALSLPVILLASVLVRPVLRLVFGEAFLPAASPFVWLMPGSFFLGIEIVLVQFLNSLGFPKSILGAWLIVVLMKIGINYWAIPAFGIVGAAIASTICYFVIFVLIVAIVWSHRHSESHVQLKEELVTS